MATETDSFNDVYITSHAFQRGKERLSLKYNAFQRLASTAYRCGLNHKDCTGRLYRYIKHLCNGHSNANNVKIYGEHVYLFKDNLLITVFSIPKDLRKANIVKCRSKKKQLLG